MLEVNNKVLIKQSNSRVVISGDFVEYYRYTKPYTYNFPPRKRKLVLVSPFVKKERRKDNVFRVKQKLKRLISANCVTWGELPKFCTFTFAENITDISEANICWGKFRVELQRYSVKKFGVKAKYLTVIEFQKRGAVHYHTLFFNLPYIDGIKDLFSDLWGYGFVQIKALLNIKSVANYVTKYLQKVLLDTRLKGEKVYFTSRGLYKPFQIREETECLDFIANNDKLDLSDTFLFNSEKYGVITYKNYKYDF